MFLFFACGVPFVSQRFIVGGLASGRGLGHAEAGHAEACPYRADIQSGHLQFHNYISKKITPSGS
ncbi:MAG: hypothetical protein A2W91_04390 [Bacteroidetes bacterium GWF2_38_335]|nr:MAG: hypothetical protein A2W91_04390 [Bacteroidetes bacterium GWF2_38_335]HBS88254.1 hypothetical protein [Bacteroidales bacterium]